MKPKAPRRARERALNLTVELEIYRAMETRARAEDRSVSAWVRRAIRAALEQTIAEREKQEAIND